MRVSSANCSRDKLGKLVQIKIPFKTLTPELYQANTSTPPQPIEIEKEIVHHLDEQPFSSEKDIMDFHLNGLRFKP